MPTAAAQDEKTLQNPLPTKGNYFYANGKRKTSIARVRMYKGEGKIIINDKAISDYCKVKTHIGRIKFPLKLTGSQKNFDIYVKVQGGGQNSQVEAVGHGISKALVLADPLNKPVLKKAGLLSRDSRTKERKKYGLKRARKSPQFSKR